MTTKSPTRTSSRTSKSMRSSTCASADESVRCKRSLTGVASSRRRPAIFAAAGWVPCPGVSARALVANSTIQDTIMQALIRFMIDSFLVLFVSGVMLAAFASMSSSTLVPAPISEPRHLQNGRTPCLVLLWSTRPDFV
jgi:hypothetical protein